LDSDNGSQQGGLAGAAWPKQSRYLSSRYLKIDGTNHRLLSTGNTHPGKLDGIGHFPSKFYSTLLNSLLEIAKNSMFVEFLI
jgi:hypothetical protein